MDRREIEIPIRSGSRIAMTRARARAGIFRGSFMADIFLGVYRDNAALGQRVWPPQIDSASCLLLRVAFPRREQHGVASRRLASFRIPLAPSIHPSSLAALRLSSDRDKFRWRSASDVIMSYGAE